jgi:hypothetical protein
MAESVWAVVGHVHLHVTLTLPYNAASADEAAAQCRAHRVQLIQGLPRDWQGQAMLETDVSLEDWTLTIEEVNHIR